MTREADFTGGPGRGGPMDGLSAEPSSAREGRRGAAVRQMTKIVIGLILLAPAVAAATDPAQPPAELLHPDAYGESKPAKFPAHAKPNAHIGDFSPHHLTFSERYFEKYKTHICAPDGCPTPLGCGTHYTEHKFVFGSCRQFFGTGDAAVGTTMTKVATRVP